MIRMYNIINYTDSCFIGVEKSDPNAQRRFSFFSAITNAVKYFDDDLRTRCQNVTHSLFRTTLTGTMIFNPLISSSITCYPTFYQSYYISEIVNGPIPGVIFQ